LTSWWGRLRQGFVLCRDGETFRWMIRNFCRGDTNEQAKIGRLALGPWREIETNPKALRVLFTCRWLVEKPNEPRWVIYCIINSLRCRNFWILRKNKRIGLATPNTDLGCDGVSASSVRFFFCDGREARSRMTRLVVGEGGAGCTSRGMCRLGRRLCGYRLPPVGSGRVERAVLGGASGGTP